MRPLDLSKFTRGCHAACDFAAVAPEGGKLDDIHDPVFWSRIAGSPTAKQFLQPTAIVRYMAPDFSFDTLFVVIGKREDGSPILHDWPVYPGERKSHRISPSFPLSRKEALETLGLHPDASPELIAKTAATLRASWHSDRSSDEADRRIREERMKQINCAVDLLSGKPRAA